MLGGPFTELILFRPVFYVLLSIVLLNSIYLIFLQDKIRASHFLILNSVLLLSASVVLFFKQGVIVSELNLSGDQIGFFVLVAMVFLIIISLFFYLRKL